MRIDNLHIISYGKLKDVRLSFSEGFNILYGENEAGKSTIMAFIKAMLYGFTGRGAEGDRKRYMPWDGGVLCGELTFTAQDGRQIVIYRKSGKTPAQDVCTFMDAVTGVPCEVDLEAEIGIGENGFLKTVYIRQLAAEVGGGDDELTDKLIRLALSGDADAGYHRAVEILKDGARFYKHQRGDGGKINEIKHAIMVLEEELSQKQEENRKLLSYMARREILEKEILEMQYTQSEQSTSRKAAEAHHALLDIRDASARVAEAEMAAQNAEEARKAEEEKLLKFSVFDRPISDIVYAETEKNSVTEEQIASFSKTGKIQTLFIFIFGLFAILALCIPVLRMFVRVPIALVFLGGMFYILKQKKRINAKQEKCRQDAQKIADFKKQKEEELAHFGCRTLQEYTDKLAEKTALCEKVEALSEMAKQYAERLQKEKEILAKKIELAEKQYGSIAEMETVDPEKVERAANDLQREIDEKRREAATIDGILSANLAEKRVADVIRTEKYALEESLKKAESAHDAIVAAQEALLAAFSELSRNFTPKINAIASRYLSEITGKEERILMDQQYRVVLDREGHKPVQFFSGGTIDQAYLAVRMAMAKLVFGDNNTPLFLDDIFFQYDAQRMQNALRLIEKTAQERQIILFSCRDIREETTANRIKL